MLWAWNSYPPVRLPTKQQSCQGESLTAQSSVSQQPSFCLLSFHSFFHSKQQEQKEEYKSQACKNRSLIK